LMFLGVLRG